MHGKMEAKKRQLLADLAEVRRQMLDVASSLPPDAQNDTFLGTWSVKELLAHLIGWDFANLEAMKDILADRLPHFYAYYDADWRAFNALLVAKHRIDDFAGMLSCVADSHRQLIAFLQTIPATAFTRDRGLSFKGWKVTMARLLQAEVDDERTHYAQIKAFVEKSSGQGADDNCAG